VLTSDIDKFMGSEIWGAFKEKVQLDMEIIVNDLTNAADLDVQKVLVLKGSYNALEQVLHYPSEIRLALEEDNESSRS